MISFIRDSPSPGEHLLRCGMDTNIYLYSYITTHRTVITCGEHLLRCGIDTSTYIVCNTIVYYSQIKLSDLSAVDSPEPVSRAPSPEPVFRATDLSAQRGFPRNTLRASGAARIALSGSGKPPMYIPRTSLSLSIYMAASSGLGNTPSRTLLFHYVSFRTDPLLVTISTTYFWHVVLTDLYTLQRGRNTQ